MIFKTHARQFWALTVYSVLFSVSLVLAAAPVKYVEYHDRMLGFTVKVPHDWSQKSTGRAAAFTGPGDVSNRPALGILRGDPHGSTIEQAAQKEYVAKGKPSDWKQSPAKVDEQRAIKVITTLKDDSSRRVVEYYVEHGEEYYLIQCIAPAAEWNAYSGIFATVLRTFHITI